LDWEKAKQAGIKFAIIKAMNGVYESKFWKENWEGAKAVGILRGAYQWLYPASVVSPGSQARKYWELMQADPGELPLTVDFEWTNPKNPDASDLYGIVKPLDDLSGRKTMIYTAPGYWNQYGSQSPFWAEHPLWQAQYRVLAPQPMPPFGNWKFHQFTANGDGFFYGFPVTGERACTLNYWCGSEDELRKWAGVAPVVEPPVEPPVVGLKQWTVAAQTQDEITLRRA
jgi:lysozyme